MLSAPIAHGFPIACLEFRARYCGKRSGQMPVTAANTNQLHEFVQHESSTSTPRSLRCRRTHELSAGTPRPPGRTTFVTGAGWAYGPCFPLAIS